MARFPAPVKARIDADDPEVKLWRDRIGTYQADFEKWEKRCEKILKRYRDERRTGEGSGSQDDKTRRYNCLWANTQTLRPALYGQQPVVIVERRFLDRDPVARAAASIWERAIRYESDDSHLHRTLKKCVLDYLLVARGVPWVRYEPQFGPSISPSPSAEDDGEDKDDDGDNDGDRDVRDSSGGVHSDSSAPGLDSEASTLLTECAPIEYVHWRDFFHGQARIWEENDFVGRRLFMDEAEVEARFGQQVANDIDYAHRPEGMMREAAIKNADDDSQKAEVFEIWSKRDKKVRFIATGYPHLLEEPREDPLQLHTFWPCPEPLYATLTNDSLVPVPDFLEYQDQAQEIDDLTNRISSLQKALKVAGVYDASAQGLSRLLNEGNDNELIPVKNWAMFSEKGGLEAAISWLPIDQVAKVLLSLYEARDKVKVDLNEITGIADILRGQSDPNETLGAQRIKSNYGSLRLQDRQAEVARFCRDTIRIQGEIIATHFADETLIRISGALYDEALMKPNPLLALISPPTGAPQGQGAPAPPGPPRAGVSAGGQPPIAGAPSQPPASPPAPGGGPATVPQQPPPVNPQTGMPFTPEEIDKLPKMVPDMDLIGQALKLLRDEKLRGFRIDIETDSTVQPDVDQEKSTRNEFITAVTGFLETAMQVSAGMPDAIPMLGKLLQFGVRGFRVGRDLEKSIDEFVDKAERTAKAKEGQPPPPNPELMKAQAQVQKTQADIEHGKQDLQLRQQDAAMKMAETNRKAQSEEQTAQINRQNEHENRQADMAMKQTDMQTKREQSQADLQIKAMEIRIKEMELQHKQQDLHIKSLMADRDVQFKDREMAHKDRMADHDIASKQHDMALKQQDHEDKKKAVAADRQQGHEATSGALSQMAEMQKSMMEMMQRMHAPRRIERDKNGRALRVVTEDSSPSRMN